MKLTPALLALSLASLPSLDASEPVAGDAFSEGLDSPFGSVAPEEVGGLVSPLPPVSGARPEPTDGVSPAGAEPVPEPPVLEPPVTSVHSAALL